MPEAASQAAAQAAAAAAGTAAGVSLGTPAAAAQAAAAGSPTGSEAAAAASGDPWYKAHVKDADNLKTIETRKWDSVEAVVKSYRELETAYSSKGAASQAPSDPKEYIFNVPDALKGSYNQQFADGFRQWAHKAGISKEAAATLHDEFVNYAGAQFSAQQQSATESLSTTVAKAKGALEKAWGADTTPAFSRNLEMAKRAISQLDPELMDELRGMGAIVKVGNDEMIAKPALFKALAKAGGQLFAEDTLFGDAAKVANPFDPKTANMQMQGKIIREDPAKAKLLIRAAGAEAVKMYEHFLNG